MDDRLEPEGLVAAGSCTDGHAAAAARTFYRDTILVRRTPEEVAVDPLLAVVIVIGGVLLAVTVYMEWIGIMNLVTPRSGPRYDDCGHVRGLPFSSHTSCWACRHRRLDAALHAAEHRFHRNA